MAAIFPSQSAEARLQASTKQDMLSRIGLEKAALSVIVLLYVALGLAYARWEPWGEAPDEPAHMRYAEYIVRYGRLPIISDVHPYTNEAQQPPLYYVLGAAEIWGYRAAANLHLNSQLFANIGIDPKVLQPSPVLIVPIMQHTADNRFPFYGYMLRGLSLVLGIGTILLTFSAARVVVPAPASPAVALLAAAFLAFIPQRMFQSISVSNENLSTLIAAWLCLLIAVRLRTPSGPQKPPVMRFAMLGTTPAWMGVALGLGLLSKYTLAVFAPVLVWALWVAARGSLRRFAADLALMGAVTALITLPFFIFNTLTYGDPLASAAVARMLPNDSSFHLGDLFWLKQPFSGFLWTSFWGVFGWQRLWMPDAFYNSFALLTWAGILGGIRLLWVRALQPTQRQFCVAALMLVGLTYAAIVLYSLRVVAWQGRELFPMLPAVCILLGIGICGLVLGRRAVLPEALSSGENSPEESKDRRQLGYLAVPIVVTLILLALNGWALLVIRDVFGALWHTAS